MTVLTVLGTLLKKRWAYPRVNFSMRAKADKVSLIRIFHRLGGMKSLFENGFTKVFVKGDFGG